MSSDSTAIDWKKYDRIAPWENDVFSGGHLIASTAKLRWRSALIVAGILIFAVAHWVAPPSENVHNLLYHLEFIPMLTAGMLFGWRGALGAALLTGAAEAPQLWVVWRGDFVFAADQIGELSVFGIASIVVGLLADRERHQRASLARTTLELEKVHSELHQNIERLKKAERLSAVAQLSASLAHEIRNPLEAIAGAAGILKRGNASPENFDDCLDIIDLESVRLNKLLTNFLNFARPRAPRLQPTDLSAVIDSVVVLAGHSDGASEIAFRRVVTPDLPEVQCDPEQLKQVLLNLVINAIQATGHGTVELRAFREGPWVSIEVRDEGSGISPEQQEHMFDPFFTTKEQGTGLGLAIASKIVEQHGGTLAARNLAGRGAALIVQLPLTGQSRS